MKNKLNIIDRHKLFKKTMAFMAITTTLTTGLGANLGGMGVIKAHAEEANVSWMKTFNGSDLDYIRDVVATADGGTVVLLYGQSKDGSFAGTTYKIPTYLIKYDRNNNMEWKTTILGKTATECVISQVKQSSDGGYILGGYSVGQVYSKFFERDIYVTKVDANGNIKWERTLQGSNREELLSFEETSDGGVIIGGDTRSNDYDFSSLGLQGNDYYDSFVAKLDANGNVQWKRGIWGTTFENLISVTQSKDGGYFAVVNSYSKDGLLTTPVNKGSTDMYIMKYDANGRLLWKKNYGGENADPATKVIKTSDGGLVISGITYSRTGDFKARMNGYNDCFVTKVDAEGNIQWTKILGNNQNETVSGLVETTDGGYIVGGRFQYGYGDFVSKGNVNYDEDMFVAKLDSNGAILWKNSFGGTKRELMDDLQATSDGGCIIGGLESSKDKDFFGLNKTGTDDAVVIKIGSDGNKEWIKTLGSSGSDNVEAIAETIDGNYVAGGYFGKPDGDFAGEVGIYYDAFIVKIGNSGAVADTEAPKLTVEGMPTAYLNKDITLTLKATDNVSIKSITLPNGQAVNGDNATFTVSENGTYTFTVEDASGNKTTETITIDKIDKALPEISINNVPTEWTNKEVALGITATDNTNGSGIKSITLPDGTIVNDANAQFIVNENGTYTFKSVDNAGNEKIQTITIDKVDTQAPVAKVENNPIDWVNHSVTLNVNATDNASGVRAIQLPNGNWVNSSEVFYDVAENGNYTFNVQDNVGNIKSLEVAVTKIDTIAPQVLTENIPVEWTNESATITIKGSDILQNTQPLVRSLRTFSFRLFSNVANNPEIGEPSGVKAIQLPDGTWVEGDTITYTATENGIYNFKVKDFAGNIASRDVVIDKIDKEAPQTPMITGEDDSFEIIPGEDTMSGTKEVVYSINGGEWVNTLNKEELPVGYVTIEAKTIDNAGNESYVVSTKVLLTQKVIDAVDKSEETDLQEDLDYAKDLINQLPECPIKDELVNRIEKEQIIIEKVNIVKEMEEILNTIKNNGISKIEAKALNNKIEGLEQKISLFENDGKADKIKMPRSNKYAVAKEAIELSYKNPTRENLKQALNTIRVYMNTSKNNK